MEELDDDARRLSRTQSLNTAHEGHGLQAEASVVARRTDMQQKKARTAEAEKAYGRGRKIAVKSVRDKKLRGNLKTLEARYKDAAIKAKDAEILLENTSGLLEPENDIEKTYKVRQDDVRNEIGIETAKKSFELKLEELGPYIGDYTRNGRSLLLAGSKGHAATVEWRAGKLGCELQLRETIRDAKWLHNDQYFALAQKKYVYIYDHAGVEIHCLKNHIDVTHMEFLPYHFLLGTVGRAGYLKYTDTSIGTTVTEIPTKLGSPTALAQNPSNAILHVGHHNGTVTLWSPNTTTPLVKMLCHRGPIRSMAIDRSGRYMVSTGQDLKMCVWDIRMYKEVNQYFTRNPANSLAISDRDLTAVGWGTHVSIWKGLYNSAHGSEQEKVQSPYMNWGGEGQQVERVKWCPFEDVLGISHNQGFSSIIIPGAGEPNYDALELNPYETTKQRQEGEVRSLLNKLQPEMISLNPDFLGTLDTKAHEKAQIEKDRDSKPVDPTEKLKNRGRGKNSALRKYLRKKGNRNVIDEKKLKIEAMRKDQDAQARGSYKSTMEDLGPALGRFVRKHN